MDHAMVPRARARERAAAEMSNTRARPVGLAGATRLDEAFVLLFGLLFGLLLALVFLGGMLYVLIFL
jgi:hypothetical protein